MSARPCKLCGREILLARRPGGKLVALDAESRSQIFELSDSSEELVALQPEPREVYVAHEMTCSGSKVEL